VFLVLFALTIPAANWLIGNAGTVCPPGGPCLIPVGARADGALGRDYDRDRAWCSATWCSAASASPSRWARSLAGAAMVGLAGRRRRW